MAFAKDALSRAGKSIGRLAEEIGYESASALSTAFHKRIGPRRAHLPVPRSVPPNEMPTKVLMRQEPNLNLRPKADVCGVTCLQRWKELVKGIADAGRGRRCHSGR